MNNVVIGAYRTSLDNLRRATNDLAAHLDTADSAEFVTRNTTFVELWASYKRALDECRESYRLIPAKHKHAVPSPPDC